MIRKSGHRFSLATSAERVCAEIMLKQKEIGMTIRRSVIPILESQPDRRAGTASNTDGTERCEAQFLGSPPCKACALAPAWFDSRVTHQFMRAKDYGSRRVSHTRSRGST